jgi:type II secretory ATPase GspE/PulE/Tfp pilus assembly ATPase PilB-like protein
VGALSAVCSQRLVRTLCTACGGEGVDDGPAEQAIRRDPRCPACGDSGYRGRTACGHVAVMDERIRGLLLARSPAGALREAIARQGPDLVADARRLEAEGVTRRDELLRVLGTLD